MAIDMEEKKRPGAINGMIKTLLEDIPSDWIRCHVISGMICALICLSKETLFHPANLKYLEDARTMLKWEISQSILSTRTYTHK